MLQSLDKKKFRQKYNMFLVEGNKIIRELKKTPHLIKELYTKDLSGLDFMIDNTYFVDEKQLKKISFLQHPKDSIAVCEMKPQKRLDDFKIQLILDGIQDPGNLGTIIRLADWFGIEQIICSEDTVDFHNPKVIQASMGSFVRVNIVYESLSQILSKTSSPIYGTDMKGENLYETVFPEEFYLILGNEGNGIRREIKKQIQKNIFIPRFGKNQSTESLNVSIATGIILGQIYGQKP